MPLLQRLAPRNIAVLRASRIGDFVCATPALRALRAAVPDARITLVGLPIVADLAARSPSLDRFEPFPGMPGIAEQWFDARRATRFLHHMQQKQFDLALQMHGSGVFSNPVALMFGARATAGFVRPGDGAGLLDAAFPFPGHGPEIERLLAFTAFLGAPAHGLRTDFPLTAEDERVARLLLAGTAPPLVGVHAGARERTKRWPPDRFAAVANAITCVRGGTVVILNGPDDDALFERIGAQLRGPVCRLPSDIPLPVLGAVIRHLAVLVTNDSGPAHIGYACNTPTVTVFGGSEPERWRPLVPGPFRLLSHEAACRPCDYAACPYEDACLLAVSVEDVVEAAGEIMRQPC